MNAEIINILHEYPLLIPHQNFKKWQGFIQGNDDGVYVQITTPQYPSLNGVDVKCPPEILPLMVQLNRNMEETSLLNLLRSMTHVLKSKSQFVSQTIEVGENMLETLIIILKELDDLESGNLLDLNHEERTITLIYEDSRGKSHEICLQFDIEYPNTAARIKNVDLPAEILTQLEGQENIKQIFERFKDGINSLIPFWEITDELEKECWVIAPENPLNKDTYRRIFLSTDLSLLLTFNITRVNDMPEIKFFGCVSTVEQCRTQFMHNLEKNGWDFGANVVSNLKRLLNITGFPQKATSSGLGDPLECLICASAELENCPPAQKWCNNDKCSSVYHRSCLYKWFEGLQTAKRCFDFLQGPCPYCKSKIWCPLYDDMVVKK